jgi:hypothetical protein
VRGYVAASVTLEQEQRKDIAQPINHPQLTQEVEEIIQQCPFVQSVHPIDDLFPIQAPGYARIIPASRLPTQPFGQVLCNFFPCLVHGPPPSMVCPLAIRESRPHIKPFAYIGISEPLNSVVESSSQSWVDI